MGSRQEAERSRQCRTREKSNKGTGYLAYPIAVLGMCHPDSLVPLLLPLQGLQAGGAQASLSEFLPKPGSCPRVNCALPILSLGCSLLPWGQNTPLYSSVVSGILYLGLSASRFQPKEERGERGRKGNLAIKGEKMVGVPPGHPVWIHLHWNPGSTSLTTWVSPCAHWPL